eukprot:6221387-Ditylum_brightwellii.AAC.1
MGQVDSCLSVQSEDGTTAWKTPSEIPTGAVFTTAFAIKQEIPLKGPAHMKAYATLLSKLQLNTIKFENKVYSYIQTYNVYIQPDMFQRNDMVSPGVVVHVHPTLERKNNLLKEMKTQLAQNKVPHTE